MNIKKALLKEHSKNQCGVITKYIGSNKERFAELMKCFLKVNTGLRKEQHGP